MNFTSCQLNLNLIKESLWKKNVTLRFAKKHIFHKQKLYSFFFFFLFTHDFLSHIIPFLKQTAIFLRQ